MELQKRHLDAIAEHFKGITKSLRDLAASHERLHKAADITQECHKLHGLAHAAEVRAGRIKPGSELDKAHALHKAAHESFRLERLKHKAVHSDHVAKVTDGLTNILNVLRSGTATADTTSPGTEQSEPRRLFTAKVAKAGERVFKNANSPFETQVQKAAPAPQSRPFANEHSPFTLLRKAATENGRVSPHERNPHLTG